ncbi:MAG: hypothetical protein LBL99_02655 [Holosporaceae bacterium]|jgi:hypoxanthine phosphoribosyltransferase|nr:hypothetical protein [Holosporaceae bacterium]
MSVCESEERGRVPGDEYLEKAKKLWENTELVYSSSHIDKAIASLAEKMNAKFADENPIIVCVLAGAATFMGQLLTKLSFYLQTDFVRVASFSGDKRGELVWDTKPKLDCAGRTVIIVDDVIDSGLTFAELVRFYKESGAKAVYTVAFFDKIHARCEKGLQNVDFCGVALEENHFLIGYGLDYHGYFRNLPDVYIYKGKNE